MITKHGAPEKATRVQKRGKVIEIVCETCETNHLPSGPCPACTNSKEKPK